MDSSLINIIEVARVTPDSSEPLTLPFTFYDLPWLIFPPIKRVIFYPLSDATRSYFDSVVVPNLKSSLALSLSHYLPLAGQVVWEKHEPKPSIVYSPNDTVSFTVAESNSDDFSRLSGNNPFPAIQLDPLLPELQISDDSASAVSLQVTLFSNKGFCIGVISHHAVTDGKTITDFLKSWAHTCKHLEDQTPNPSLPENLIPSYDRTCIEDPPDVVAASVMNDLVHMSSGRTPTSLKLLPSPKVGPEVMRFTFELTPEDIQTLRERLKRESPKELRLSTFVIAYSYAITCAVRARGGDPKRPVGYIFAVNCRSLLHPPIAENYFGNCISATFIKPVEAKTFMDEKDGFLAAATMISDSVGGLDKNLPLKQPDFSKMMATAPPGLQLFSVSGSPKFGVYGLDFGWGKPDKVLVASLSHAALSLTETKDGSGGVEIGFILEKQETELLADLLRNGINK